ncbi:MAG: hypothetical protein TU35_009530 [Thermoproteus sp. AZ2]|jgi:hypothetical protein|uniref:Uncharacterized protein n=1 Tax=Thermoproteus sp. AZ2 TaxID=1609232 RepID=A0ACC6V3B4_9CREN
METAQMVLIFVLAAAIALALFFIAMRMIASAPVPQIWVDEYNTVRLQNAAIVAVRSNGPMDVKAAWLLNGSQWVSASACGANMTELLTRPHVWNCGDASYFFLYFPASLAPGKYVIRIEAAFGNGAQNYTTSFVLG